MRRAQLRKAREQVVRREQREALAVEQRRHHEGLALPLRARQRGQHKYHCARHQRARHQRARQPRAARPERARLRLAGLEPEQPACK